MFEERVLLKKSFSPENTKGSPSFLRVLGFPVPCKSSSNPFSFSLYAFQKVDWINDIGASALTMDGGVATVFSFRSDWTPDGRP